MSINWLVAAAVLVAAPATAQTKPAAAPPALEPAAWAAVEAMGAYLRTLKSFDVTAEGTTEEVLGTGQKLSFPGKLSYAVAVPDKLFLETVSDRAHRRFFYDGKTITIEVPRVKLYTDAPLPGTITTLFSAASAKYDIEFPLQDLFLFGTPEAVRPTSGFVAGSATIGTTRATHYAFRQPGVDWQIWIADGPTPVPVKIVMTSTIDAARPQYAGVLNWTVNPVHTADQFTFAKPAGTGRIAIASVGGTK